MKKRVTIKVEKVYGENYFTCYMVEDMPHFGLAGFGKSARAAIENLLCAQEEIRAHLAKEGKAMPDLEFHFKFDIGAFFNYYDCLNIAGVARRIGINASLMRRYAIGLSQPRKERKKEIEECLHQIGRELQTTAVG